MNRVHYSNEELIIHLLAIEPKEERHVNSELITRAHSCMLVRQLSFTVGLPNAGRLFHSDPANPVSNDPGSIYKHRIIG